MSFVGWVFEARTSGPDDYPLLVDSFKKSLAKEKPGKKPRWKDAEDQRELFDRILLLDETESRVLCAKDNRGHIAGWIAYTPLGEDIVAIHFAFVKRNYRPLRLGDDLFRLSGAEGKRLLYTFGGAVADKLATRLVAEGRLLSASHVPAEAFLLDMGEASEAREPESRA